MTFAGTLAILAPRGGTSFRHSKTPMPGVVTQVELDAFSTEELMSAYVSGDIAAFDLLYKRLSPKIFGFLLRLTRRRERAEDLLQVTFGKVHRARGSYLKDAPLLPWILAIARRSFYDEVRSKKRRQEYLSADGEVPEPAQSGSIGVHSRPLNHGAAVELTDALDHAFNQLPAGTREAIQLTKITGLSVAEAAQVIGTTPTAVKLRVHRGYKTIRAILEKEAAHATEAKQGAPRSQAIGPEEVTPHPNPSATALAEPEKRA